MGLLGDCSAFDFPHCHVMSHLGRRAEQFLGGLQPALEEEAQQLHATSGFLQPGASAV